MIQDSGSHCVTGALQLVSPSTTYEEMQKPSLYSWWGLFVCHLGHIVQRWLARSSGQHSRSITEASLLPQLDRVLSLLPAGSSIILSASWIEYHTCFHLDRVLSLLPAGLSIILASPAGSSIFFASSWIEYYHCFPSWMEYYPFCQLD